MRKKQPDVPEWLCDLLRMACTVENITEEQAARLFLVRGALWWEADYYCRHFDPPARN